MLKKIPVVIAGCGSITSAWFDALEHFPEFSIVGVVDINIEAAERLNAERGLHALSGTDLERVIAAVKPEVVFDCTIPEAHCGVTLPALQAGCHVLGEKPMAANMEEAHRMVKAAEEAGKNYSVIQNRRYNKNIIAFKNLINTGEIGTLTTLNADFYLAPHFGGFRDEMKHVLLLDMAIHSFDEARFISGCDPVSVYCYEWNPSGSWYHHGASAAAIFEMSNGLIFTYRGSWCAEGLNTSWESSWRAQGEKGVVTWDGNEAVRGEVASTQKGFIHEQRAIEPAQIEELRYSGHSGVIAEFRDFLNSKAIPQTVCTDNIKSLAMVHAAIASAESGKKISIKL
ncbi:MAG: Gfo/Idh/MocA family oxidoreductase [Bacteroidetes bacterium]|nr:Gfo/Idh/MocA family oxidoreductase [Bacteroidota bacterium]